MPDRRGRLLQASLLRVVRRAAWGHAQKLLEKSNPIEIAQVVDRLREADRQAVFDLIQAPEVRAEVLGHLQFVRPAALLGGSDPVLAARILAEMAPEKAAEILRELGRDEAEPILEALGEDAAGISSLLGYPEDSAGAIMSPDCLSLTEDLTAAEAIERLRKQADIEPSFYVYVVDERNHLVGVLSLRQLITAPPDKQLRNCMVADPVRVTSETDREEVARLVDRYDLLAVPVVDASNRLLGVVPVDDVVDVMREEATEDILKMAGTTLEEVTSPSPLRGAWIRFPWLAASFIGGLLGIALLGRFEAVLSESLQLAFFMPIILGMGGNVGSQCAMVVVRGLATDRLDPSAVGRILRREIGTALLLAVAFGVGLGVCAALLGYGPARLPVVVGLAIAGSMLIAASVGTLLPLVFSRVGVDPAVASGPLMTTSTDVLGIVSFFLIALVLL
jgi:magnesium transporter